MNRQNKAINKYGLGAGVVIAYFPLKSLLHKVFNWESTGMSIVVFIINVVLILICFLIPYLIASGISSLFRKKNKTTD